MGKRKSNSSVRRLNRVMRKFELDAFSTPGQTLSRQRQIDRLLWHFSRAQSVKEKDAIARRLDKIRTSTAQPLTSAQIERKAALSKTSGELRKVKSSQECLEKFRPVLEYAFDEKKNLKAAEKVLKRAEELAMDSDDFYSIGSWWVNLAMIMPHPKTSDGKITAFRYWKKAKELFEKFGDKEVLTDVLQYANRAGFKEL